jgi:hypothetical protein
MHENQQLQQLFIQFINSVILRKRRLYQSCSTEEEEEEEEEAEDMTNYTNHSPYDYKP